MIKPIYWVIVIVVFIAVLVIAIVALLRHMQSGNLMRRTKVSEDDEITKKTKFVDVQMIVDEEYVYGNGMIVFNNHRSYRLYLAVIGGSNYYEGDIREQIAVENGYTEFVMGFTKPVQYTIQNTINRIDGVLDRYQRRYDEMKAEYETLALQVDKLRARLQMNDMTSNEKDEIRGSIEEIENELKALEGMMISNEAQVERMNQRSNNRKIPKKRHIYVLKYDFDDTFFKGVDLTDEEIAQRADRELSAMARTRIKSLRIIGIAAKIVTDTNEVVDILRKHKRPRSGDTFRMEDYKKTSLDQIVVTSKDTRDKKVEFLKAVSGN